MNLLKHRTKESKSEWIGSKKEKKILQKRGGDGEGGREGLRRGSGEEKGIM